MRCIWLILFLSITYIGCATRIAGPARGEQPVPAARDGGTLRVWLPGGTERSAASDCAADSPWSRVIGGRGVLGVGPSGEPLPGWATSWRQEPLPPPPDGPAIASRVRWVLEPAPAATPTADEVIATWESRMRDGCSGADWLLAPVVGQAAARLDGRRVPGLQQRGGSLTLVLDRLAPDLPARLAHPALSAASTAGAGGAPRRIALDAPPPGDRRVAYLEALELVGSGRDDPRMLLRLGEVDLAIVTGRGVRALTADPRRGLEARRLPEWDTTYALWLSPASRLGREPETRRRLVAPIDRERLVPFLFEDGARPARGLVVDAPPPVADDGVPRELAAAAALPRDRPVSATLLYDGGDPVAASIASRLRADLLSADVRLELAPAEGAELRRRLAAGLDAMVLLAHRHGSPDPLLGLRETLSPLGRRAAGELAEIDRACGRSDPALRIAAAQRLEQRLAAAARLVPLVRVEAWLVHRRGLVGLQAGPWGSLTLERAGWRR